MKKMIRFENSDMKKFAENVRALLGRNFSSLTEDQRKRIEALEGETGEVFLTYPVCPYMGEKFVIIDGGKYEGESLGEVLTSSGKYGDEHVSYPNENWGQDYWDAENDFNLGHALLPLDLDLFVKNPELVAISGTSDSVISVKVSYCGKEDLFEAVATVETPGDYQGLYWQTFNEAVEKIRKG